MAVHPWCFRWVQTIGVKEHAVLWNKSDISIVMCAYHFDLNQCMGVYVCIGVRCIRNWSPCWVVLINLLGKHVHTLNWHLKLGGLIAESFGKHVSKYVRGGIKKKECKRAGYENRSSPSTVIGITSMKFMGLELTHHVLQCSLKE